MHSTKGQHLKVIANQNRNLISCRPFPKLLQIGGGCLWLACFVWEKLQILTLSQLSSCITLDIGTLIKLPLRVIKVQLQSLWVREHDTHIQRRVILESWLDGYARGEFLQPQGNLQFQPRLEWPSIARVVGLAGEVW